MIDIHRFADRNSGGSFSNGEQDNYNSLQTNNCRMLQESLDVRKNKSEATDTRLKASTLSPSFHQKMPLLYGDPRERILAYFQQTYDLYEKLFTLVNNDEAYYLKPQPLRHPLIFYYGHTACVYVNKLLDKNLLSQRINPYYEQIFAVGVDEMDWDDLNETHYNWPTVQKTKQYRQLVREVVLGIIKACNCQTGSWWDSDLWVVLMGIEHERIHLETSAVIMRRLPIKDINPVQTFLDCPLSSCLEDIPKNYLVEIERSQIHFELKHENVDTYGWDNEFGRHHASVQAFKASAMLVSNGDYLQFVKEGGYQQEKYWTREGKLWLKSIKPKHPLFWVHKPDADTDNDSYLLRTMTTVRLMPWNWPVQVNNLEARAYCQWLSQKDSRRFRLPTEDEYNSIRALLQGDHLTWQQQSVGNINLQCWFSPSPVDLFKTVTPGKQQLYGIVGNVWQHTITPIYPFTGFQVHPIYEDFTTPTFGNLHDIIKGGSFISTGNQSLARARYSFRRHFHQFAGIRYVQVPEERDIEIDQHNEESEVVTDHNVEMALRLHYLEKESYVNRLIDYIKGLVSDNQRNREVVIRKVATVGCSVGGITLALSPYFTESVGIDYTTRYFKMSTRLKERGKISYHSIDIQIHNRQALVNAMLFQMNPENPDCKKINNCDFLLIDGLSLRPGRIAAVLQAIHLIASDRCLVGILMSEQTNWIQKRDVERILKDWKSGAAVVQFIEAISFEAVARCRDDKSSTRATNTPTKQKKGLSEQVSNTNPEQPCTANQNRLQQLHLLLYSFSL